MKFVEKSQKWENRDFKFPIYMAVGIISIFDKSYLYEKWIFFNSVKRFWKIEVNNFRLLKNLRGQYFTIFKILMGGTTLMLRTARPILAEGFRLNFTSSLTEGSFLEFWRLFSVYGDGGIFWLLDFILRINLILLRFYWINFRF